MYGGICMLMLVFPILNCKFGVPVTKTSHFPHISPPAPGAIKFGREPYTLPLCGPFYRAEKVRKSLDKEMWTLGIAVVW